MSRTLEYIRQHIREMPSYEPILPFDVLSEELGIPVDRLIKLDANENPYGPIPEVMQALSSLDTLHIYPDPESRRIKGLLAEHHQIPEASIVVGAGADELIDLIIRVSLEPGDRQINCPPTFGMYAFDGKLNQASLISVRRRPDFSLDLESLQRAVKDHQPKVLFLANPNNPDGGMISDEMFNKLVDLPLLLVMDEAYIPFSNEGKSVLDKVQFHQNLVVLRTFSKWAGLAGVRIGYGGFPLEFVPMLMKVKQPYNVSSVAEQAAVVTMWNLPKAVENISRIIEQRRVLYQGLEQVPWLDAYPSQANFILCRVKGIPAIEVKQRLRAEGILIRHFDKPGLSDHIRLSVGKKDQIEALITALKGIR